MLARNNIARSDIDIRYLRNQILPDINAQATYISTGVGGVQFYLDGATLGAEDTTAPYGVTWDTHEINGVRHLTAEVHETSGRWARIASLTLRIASACASP